MSVCAAVAAVSVVTVAAEARVNCCSSQSARSIVAVCGCGCVGVCGCGRVGVGVGGRVGVGVGASAGAVGVMSAVAVGRRDSVRSSRSGQRCAMQGPVAVQANLLAASWLCAGVAVWLCGCGQVWPCGCGCSSECRCGIGAVCAAVAAVSVVTARQYRGPAANQVNLLAAVWVQ